MVADYLSAEWAEHQLPWYNPKVKVICLCIQGSAPERWDLYQVENVYKFYYRKLIKKTLDHIFKAANVARIHCLQMPIGLVLAVADSVLCGADLYYIFSLIVTA